MIGAKASHAVVRSARSDVIVAGVRVRGSRSGASAGCVLGVDDDCGVAVADADRRVSRHRVISHPDASDLSGVGVDEVV
jgi:hypothetical protein